MKTILMILLFVTIGVSGMWEKLQSFGDPTVESIAYDVEAKGWNFRAYEFVPKNAPHKLCVVVTSEKSNMQLECFDRQIKSETTHKE